jgi:hypothetical protein
MNCRNTTKLQSQRTRWWGKAAALAALLMAGSASAQVSAYSFTQTTGTYTPITGTQIIAPGTDDGNSAAINIGFTFGFNGSAFTQFVARSNGHIRLGSTAPTGSTTPISTTSNTNAISAFGRDGLAFGGFFVETSGTPGSRVCVIQMNDYQVQWNATTSRVNVQIRLYETTNVVEIVYGSGTQTATVYTGQVGLRGGTGATDFNNRTTTTNWAATTAGGTSAATCSYSTAAFPASGLTYTWTPPPPPACPTPASVTANPVVFNGATINWGCLSCTGSFIVEYGLTGFTPGTGATAGAGGTVISGAVSPQAITGLSASTGYQVYVRQDCGIDGFSANSAVVAFTTPAPPPANDDCINAIALTSCTGGAQTLAGTTLNSTVDAVYTNCGAGGSNTTERGVWYVYTGDDNAVTINTCSATGYDSRITVYSGSCGALVCEGANDDATCTFSGLRSQVTFNANSGTDYFIFVHGFQNNPSLSATGNFVLNWTCAPLCVPVPGNDACANAQALTVDAPATAGDNTCAAATPGNPTCESAFATLPDVFYSFVASTGGSNIVTINLATATNLGYAIYDACGGTQVACIANVTSGVPNTHGGLTGGNTYFIRVQTNDGSNGSFTIGVSEPCQPAGTLAAVNDCGNGQYFINVNVTSLGTSGDLDITTDFVGDTEPTSVGLGITQIGPYPAGTPVVVTLVHDLGGACNLTLAPFNFNCPPANDDCGGAIALTVNADFACGTVTAGTTAAATASPQPDVDSGTPDDDVWFSFVATATTHRVSLLNVSGFADMGHSVYRALPDPCAAGGMTLVNTSDPDVSNPAGLTIGETYFVRVYAWGTGASSVTFNICIGTQPPPPANDLCANAIAIGCNSVVTGTTVNATNTGAPASCGNYVNNATSGVWYTITGWNGPMVASLCTGTSYDSQLAVFTGSCGAFTCVAGSDDFCGSQSQVTWTGTAGTTYYIYVAGWNAAAGPFTLTTTCGSNNPTCPANGLTVEFQTDAAPFETTWEIRNGAGNVVASSGGPLVAPSGIQTESSCLPDGCYTLRVLDAGGDGMTTGGYILRTQGTNQRIIDNRNNFSTGSVSAISGGQAFCLPLSTQTVLFTSCDKLDWVTGQYIVAAPNPAVSAEWIPNGANSVQDNNSGYEFWIFDPNGSYSFRRFRSHNVSDGFGPASATRACHMKINNWAVASQIPQNTLMNVRVRTRINGANGEFGPACRMAINPALAACPQTLLFNIPGDPDFSCGATRQWGAGNFVFARPVSGANRYQFRFRIAAEGFEVVRTATTYFVQLNWAVLPLQNGKTYDVDVRVSKDGGVTWCSTSNPWGQVCQLTIGTPQFNAMSAASENNSVKELRMFPNPNRGDVLNVSLTGIEEGVNTVSVDIYDLTGKRMSARTLAVAGNSVITTMDLSGELAAGMYLVNITAGSTTYTERLVIQP